MRKVATIGVLAEAFCKHAAQCCAVINIFWKLSPWDDNTRCARRQHGAWQAVGSIAAQESSGGDVRLHIKTGKLPMGDVALGDSIIGLHGRSRLVEKMSRVFEEENPSCIIAVQEVTPDKVSSYGIVNPAADGDGNALAFRF